MALDGICRSVSRDCNSKNELKSGFPPFVELRVKASDVFLCSLHPKNEAERPFWWAPRLTNVLFPLKMTPRDRLCGL